MREGHERDDLFINELCDTYFKPVYKYCKKLIKSQPELMDFADECTQNTFLEARKQISKLKRHPNVEGWLFTTARNFINLSFRAMYIRKRREVIITDDINYRLELQDNEIDQLVENAVDVDELYHKVLMKLSSSEYELYTDYYLKKMSIAELTRKYNVSANAITTRIYRINKKIRSIVQTLVVSLDI
ncbi:sigma-70 family RNA polymerase sigma factor [Paenibacillus sp. MER TA 81-3]|uniref:RNA polymerase sigma factor n=1 Tax=Paenibacillus sp. MER TA 81-3 TaxID=2939573 RepID=UPI00203E4199|nr:sigma-70 family RNA polymerase sigma factor [Paenibacillus sp. MER TA 81-3]MCM3341192.1 sigma-70 family RNA polymerase sigma factor [Paenibacillus sp. MER TA 81-3]